MSANNNAAGLEDNAELSPFGQVMAAEGKNKRLHKSDFTLTNATAGAKTVIAEFEAPWPLILRDDAPIRLALTVHETFTTDATGSNQETFTLTEDIYETPNTEPLILYDSGTLVSPDSVDYANNQFDYTNPDASADTLDVYYVARDPVLVEVVKAKPGAQTVLEETVFDETTAALAEQDQNDAPFYLSSDKSQMQRVVPKEWKIKIVADDSVASNYAVGWNEATRNTEAANAIISLPIKQLQGNIRGLGRAVAQEMAMRG